MVNHHFIQKFMLRSRRLSGEEGKVYTRLIAIVLCKSGCVTLVVQRPPLMTADLPHKLPLIVLGFASTDSNRWAYGCPDDVR